MQAFIIKVLILGAFFFVHQVILALAWTGIKRFTDQEKSNERFGFQFKETLIKWFRIELNFARKLWAKGLPKAKELFGKAKTFVEAAALDSKPTEPKPAEPKPVDDDDDK